LVKTVLREMKNLIQFENCTIFIMQPEMMRICEKLQPDSDHVFIVRSQLDTGKPQLGISETEPVAQAAYKSLEDVKYSIKTIS